MIPSLNGRMIFMFNDDYRLSVKGRYSFEPRYPLSVKAHCLLLPWCKSFGYIKPSIESFPYWFNFYL